MGEVIIHKNERNTLSVTYKIDENLSIIEAAYRCVPEGIKFKIINSAEIQEYVNSDFFEAMEYNIELDYDGVGMSEEEWIVYLQNKE